VYLFVCVYGQFEESSTSTCSLLGYACMSTHIYKHTNMCMYAYWCVRMGVYVKDHSVDLLSALICMLHTHKYNARINIFCVRMYPCVCMYAYFFLRLCVCMCARTRIWPV